ncbi:MAG TPA: chromate efflux transporter [Vicinamibacteria bacterium]|nr:chromate efflux transporter [Vicinamibacteria bacterium]
MRRRSWLRREEFLDLLAATNLIPGPNSTEMAIHIGYRRAGWPGFLVAGACFILPAAMIVCALAAAYVRFGRLPAAEGLLWGVRPVIVVVVAQALWALGRSAVRSRPLAILAGAALVLAVAGVHELMLLLGAGLAAAIFSGSIRPRAAAALVPLPLLAPPAATLPGLLLIFLKIGSVLFGSGYVLLAFLRAELVVRLGWLTEAQLLDAVAAGQITPGPLSTTATFIGFVLRGLPGAAVSTVGIFLPAFVFVALSGPLVPRLRRSRAAGAFLDGVQVASLALMAVVTWQLTVHGVRDPFAAVIAVAAAVLLVHHRVNASWLVLGGAGLGILRSLAQ